MENPLCKYKDIFGAPNTGLHSYRLTLNGIEMNGKGLAFVDLLFTLIGAVLLSFYFKKIHPIKIFIMLVILGIVLHLLFCVKTPITQLIIN